MIKCHWIIENFVKEKSFLDLEKAVKDAGHSLQLIKGDYAHKDITHYENKCVIFSGSIEMSKIVNGKLSEKNNFPNIYCNWNAYKCSSYYPHFSDFVFNDNYVLVPLLELKKRLYQFYGLFGKNGMIFVRPDSGDKTFKAELLDLEEFEKFYEACESHKNELVLISTPKNIRGEWRFICNRKKEIIAVSSYRFQGELIRVPSAPVGATEFVKKVLDVGYYPDSVFSVDVVQDEVENFWMMELTSFSSAGLYEANKAAIVKSVTEMAIEDYETFYSRIRDGSQT